MIRKKRGIAESIDWQGRNDRQERSDFGSRAVWFFPVWFVSAAIRSQFAEVGEACFASGGCHYAAGVVDEEGGLIDVSEYLADFLGRSLNVT
jgi:hypothetical protein